MVGLLISRSRIEYAVPRVNHDLDSPLTVTLRAGPRSHPDDRALLGNNLSAAPAQEQGRRCTYTTSPFPLNLPLAQSAKSQGPGDSVPRTIES